VSQITEEMKLAAAIALADYVKNPTVDEIIPSPLDR
jgi:malic enzyme